MRMPRYKESFSDSLLSPGLALSSFVRHGKADSARDRDRERHVRNTHKHAHRRERERERERRETRARRGGIPPHCLQSRFFLQETQAGKQRACHANAGLLQPFPKQATPPETALLKKRTHSLRTCCMYLCTCLVRCNLFELSPKSAHTPLPPPRQQATESHT